jgi:hypothetical protein
MILMAFIIPETLPRENGFIYLKPVRILSDFSLISVIQTLFF